MAVAVGQGVAVGGDGACVGTGGGGGACTTLTGVGSREIATACLGVDVLVDVAVTVFVGVPGAVVCAAEAPLEGDPRRVNSTSSVLASARMQIADIPTIHRERRCCGARRLRRSVRYVNLRIAAAIQEHPSIYVTHIISDVRTCHMTSQAHGRNVLAPFVATVATSAQKKNGRAPAQARRITHSATPIRHTSC